jgi:hypothetical protein
MGTIVVERSTTKAQPYSQSLVLVGIGSIVPDEIKEGVLLQATIR